MNHSCDERLENCSSSKATKAIQKLDMVALDVILVVLFPCSKIIGI